MSINVKKEGFLIPLTRFYIMTKFELLKTEDLRLMTFKFDFECSYTNSNLHHY